MKTLPSIILPVLNRGDLLANALRSITDPVGTVYIIDNSGGADRSIERAVTIASKRLPIQVHAQKYNLGYSASMNLGFQFTKPPWISMSNDIILAPGCIRELVETAEADPELTVVGADGLICALFTPQALEKVGTFDENFYPAYCEDCDWWYRLTLTGIKTQKAEKANLTHLGSQTVLSDPELARRNKQTHANNSAYFTRKWGGIPHSETFKTPFNDPANTINRWKLDRVHYGRNWTIWNS